MVDIPRVDWYGCYDGSWQSAPLVAEAYAHPAKVSFNLAERIYRHMLAEGWLVPGDVVVDPFGGVGGFAFHAALYGMHWQGVELEQKFVDLGGQNLDLWRNRYAPHFPGYGDARLVQGDSRRLVDVLREAGAVVSSPPYAASVSQGDGANDSEARRERKVAAGIDMTDARNVGGPNSVLNRAQAYGSTPGQLGAMPAGDVGAVVSSPPYADGAQHTGGETRMTSGQGGPIAFVEYGGDPANLGNMPAGVVSSPPYSEITVGNNQRSFRPNDGRPNPRFNRDLSEDEKRDIQYGTTPGQLGAMPAGVVSSPPWETNETCQDRNFWLNDGRKTPPQGRDGYGSTLGNIGNNTGDTFWSAAAIIVQQCYAILRPGGYAAWVTGDFVRNKKRVPFGEQWLALCERVGFEPVMWAVAWKAESHGEQLDIFGNGHNQGKTKVSFFRRLANQNNPDTAIVNEDVIFVRKPL